MRKLDKSFFIQDAFDIAPKLIGQYLVRNISGEIRKYQITEIEIYYGEKDTACHARFGKTARSKTLYESGGTLYIYLCYGLHYLMNIVTGKKDDPQAILIRGIEGFNGPGNLTKQLQIDKTLNEKDATISNQLWFESDGKKHIYTTTSRIGINYAKEPYKSIKWRFLLNK